ncbi:uncharacterized protein ATNIH1004_009243 [Aspergillus tanneri]|uniref:SMP-30/Gluconolactonase/LRE-like region domain-containing protein n=1 Tax=Aspergillus tanneri TaxID=1220188 RepID=A0A5M9MDG8_9EURO|nr:uncharacterized protein ATNIH1004_009243 [Aspergillus tanneri]KAA8645032.1 hypothetical protein ATNIH1004_009243 [Aspergillus tanneri]
MTSSSRGLLVPILAILFGIYKFYIHNVIVLHFGIGRTIQPLEDFPNYSCQRIQHPLLGSCEDLWLDSFGRKLYAACSSPAKRKAWSPGGNVYDLAARTAAGGGTDYITVLDVDKPGPDGLYGARALNFRGKDGDVEELDLHGFDVRVIDGNRLRFWLINHRPPLDLLTGGQLLDASNVGANSTIEVYDLDIRRGGDSNYLEHVKTIVSDAIISPNNLVALDDNDNSRGGFLLTNDHNTRAPGVLRKLTPILGGGSISYCRTDTGQCHITSSDKYTLPNGITRDPSSGLIYVAQSGKGVVTVHSLTADNRLVQIDEIPMSMGVDNVSIDTKGNIFVGAFPNSIQLLKAFKDPYRTGAPSTVLMIRKKTADHDAPAEKAAYEVIKVVEDAEAKVLPTTTTAVHDPISGRLFLGGVTSPFMAVCERQ